MPMILDRPVVVTGSREYSDESVVASVLRMFPAPGMLRHGNAPGLDRMAGRLAEDQGWAVGKIDADWDRFGNEAGRIRNRQLAMKEPVPWLCLAFPLQGSSGTWDMIDVCESRRIPVVIIGLSGWHEEMLGHILALTR